MKAAVLRNAGYPLSIENVEYLPLKKGQVLVKVAYSGVCQSQLMEVKGKRGKDPWLPHLLGHEGTGVVLKVGPGVKKVGTNDRVVLGWIKGEGINAETASYVDENNTIINSGNVTTFNEYSVVSENRLAKLPSGVPMDIGVLFGCALPTGAGIVMHEIRPAKNASIAIFGLGGIGLSALMATNLYGCRNVIVIDINDRKLALAKELGATHAIYGNHPDIVNEVRDITDGIGVDYSVEASGNPRVIEMAFESVRTHGGLCVFASHPESGARIALNPFDLICGKRIKGSWGGASRPDRDVLKFADLYRKNKLPLEKLFDRRYQLQEINQALDDLEKGNVARPLIEIDTNLC